jgi:hypothetical protein
MLNIPNDFKEFIQLLNENEVKYLIVSGYAVVLHGYVRNTGDIDIWIKPTKNNGRKILNVLKQFGFGELDIVLKDLSSPDNVIQLGKEPLRIDLITSATNLNFDECWVAKNTIEIKGVKVVYLSLKHLKQNKKATGRYRDLDDLENLT